MQVRKLIAKGKSFLKNWIQSYFVNSKTTATVPAQGEWEASPEELWDTCHVNCGPTTMVGSRWQSLQRESIKEIKRKSHKTRGEFPVPFVHGSRKTGPFPLVLVTKDICRIMPTSSKKTLLHVGSLTWTTFTNIYQNNLQKEKKRIIAAQNGGCAFPAHHIFYRLVCLSVSLCQKHHSTRQGVTAVAIESREQLHCVLVFYSSTP